MKKRISKAQHFYKMYHSMLRRMLAAGKDKSYLTSSPQTHHPEIHKAAQLAILATGREPAPVHNHALAFSWNYGPNARVKVTKEGHVIRPANNQSGPSFIDGTGF